jgi:tRNA threonylcarbamoyladenosine modification (KEOPS) complex Cgi121 subunit
MSKHDSTVGKAFEEQQKERMDTLQKYVSDMMAVEEHIGSAVKRQLEDSKLAKHTSEASQMITEIARKTEMHEQELKRHLEILGGDAAKGIKEVATAALGSLAGVYDKMRTEAVSKMLRDDYVALNLAAAGYTMLHTTGLALNDQATAEIALRHLKDYTPIIMRFNEIVPSVVATDLRDDGATFVDSAVQEAVTNTQKAWQPSGGSNGSNGAAKSGSKK